MTPSVAGRTTSSENSCKSYKYAPNWHAALHWQSVAVTSLQATPTCIRGDTHTNVSLINSLPYECINQWSVFLFFMTQEERRGPPPHREWMMFPALLLLCSIFSHVLFSKRWIWALTSQYHCEAPIGRQLVFGQCDGLNNVQCALARGGTSRENLCQVRYWVQMLKSGPDRVDPMQIDKTPQYVQACLMEYTSC